MACRVRSAASGLVQGIVHDVVVDAVLGGDGMAREAGIEVGDHRRVPVRQRRDASAFSKVFSGTSASCCHFDDWLWLMPRSLSVFGSAATETLPPRDGFGLPPVALLLAFAISLSNCP